MRGLGHPTPRAYLAPAATFLEPAATGTAPTSYLPRSSGLVAWLWRMALYVYPYPVYPLRSCTGDRVLRWLLHFRLSFEQKQTRLELSHLCMCALCRDGSDGVTMFTPSLQRYEYMSISPTVRVQGANYHACTGRQLQYPAEPERVMPSCMCSASMGHLVYAHAPCKIGVTPLPRPRSVVTCSPCTVSSCLCLASLCLPALTHQHEPTHSKLHKLVSWPASFGA